MKTAKVTNVQSNGTWQSPNGLMYKWDIDFDNGDHGQAMTKDQEHKTWVVGESVSYTLEPNKNPQYPGKLTRIKEQPQQQQKANSSDFNAPEVVTMRECIGHACVAVAQSSFCDNTQVIIKMAEDFYNAAMSKKPKTAN